MNRSRTLFRIISILIVVAIAWTLRARAVSLLPIDYDEDDYLRAGQQFTHLMRTSDWRGFLDTNYRTVHPPLAKIIIGLSILPVPEQSLTPDEPTSAGPNVYLPRILVTPARTVNAVFGTLTVLALSLVDPLAGLMLATHTFTVKYVSQIMLEAVPALTSLLMALSYLQWKKSKGSGSKRWLIASAIFLGLTAASKYIFCVAGLAILVDWYLDAKEDDSLKPFLRNALMWGLLAVVIFFVFDPYLWPDPIGRLKESILSNANYSSGSSDVQTAGFPIWQPFVWLSYAAYWWHPDVLVFPFDTFITILAIVGLKRLWGKERLYILWLGLAIVFLLLWPTKWPQYLIILTVPLSLSAAEGLAQVWENLLVWWKNRKNANAALYQRQDTRRALPWLVPGLIVFAALTLFPLFFQFAVSLTDFNVMSIRDGFNGGILRALQQGLSGQTPALPFDIEAHSNKVNFTGFNTYQPVFNYIAGLPNQWAGYSVIFFNILWTVTSVFIQATLGLIIALLLAQRGIRLGKFWQALFILPWAIPEYIGALMWLNVLQPESGWLALAVKKYGEGIPFGFLSNWNGANVFTLALLIPAVWYGFPFMMLATSVGLKTIPNDVMDAAAIDGATALQTFQYVTWPLLLPLLLPAIIVRSIFAFNQFYLFQAYGFQDGTLATLSYNIFNPNSGFSGVSGGQFAVSAVINIITILILIVFVAIFNRLSKAGEGVTYA